MKLNKITKLILVLIAVFIADFYVTKLIQEANNQGGTGAGSTQAATKSNELNQTTLQDVDGDGYYTFTLPAEENVNFLIRNDASVRIDYSIYDDETGELVLGGFVDSGHTFQTDGSISLPSGQYHITIVSDDGSQLNTYIEINY